MALTRKLLKSLGLEEAAIDTIIDAHTETTDALKKQRDDAVALAGTAEAITKERDQLKQQVETLTKQGGDAAKVQADFDAYKQQVEAEKRAAQTDADVLAMLKEAGIQRESFLSMVSKTFDREKIQRGEDGSIANRDELINSIKTEYADCIGTPRTSPAPVVTPPSGGGKGMTREQIMAIKDPAEQRNAIAQNIQLFKSQT